MKPYHPEELTKEEAAIIIEKHQPRIEQCFVFAWGQWQRYRETLADLFADTSSRSMSSMIHDFISAEARRVFSGNPDAVISEQRGLLLVTLEDKISLRFKKLEKSLRPPPARTFQQQNFLYNHALPGIPVSIYATAAYVLDRLKTQINAVKIVRHYNKDIMWYLDLDKPMPIEEISVRLPQVEPMRRVVAKAGQTAAKKNVANE